jgi:hypothetical protein
MTDLLHDPRAPLKQSSANSRYPVVILAENVAVPKTKKEVIPLF